MKTVESIAKSLSGKKIILRLDLNVPLNKEKITDTNRIDKIIPTLHFLIKNKAKILILSHVGRPNGKIVKELSLEPVSLFIKNKIKKNVSLVKENIFNLLFEQDEQKVDTSERSLEMTDSNFKARKCAVN